MHGGGPGPGLTEFGIRSRFWVAPFPGEPTPDRARNLLATIDSGAEKTMIRQSVARDLGLKPLGEVPVFHFAGESRTLGYYAQVTCDCIPDLGWRTIHLVDDGGAFHPEDISFPELLIGRDLMQFMSVDAHGPSGKWSLEIHFDEWPSALPPPA